MHPSRHSADTLLRHLGREEDLLRVALAGAAELHAALSRGDLAAAREAAARQRPLAEWLRAAGGDREAAAEALAREAGAPGAPATLARLAAVLPPESGAELLAARERLAAAAAELAAAQARNANLLSHLRSYFRSVLAELTAPGVPARYGPSGARVGPRPGGALAHG
jgi:hypothetical protein